MTNQKRTLKKIILAGALVLAASCPIITSAQTSSSNNPATNPIPTYTPLAPLPCIPSAPTKDETGKTVSPGVDCSRTTGTQVNFQDYIQYAFNLFIFICASAAVFMIVWGGFEYMTTDSWTEKKEGKKKVINALLGLLLVLTSYIILRTIDPRLVAIPTTLVKPLNIPYSKSTLSNDVVGYIDKWSAESQDFQAATEKARADLVAQQKTKTDLETTIHNLAPNGGSTSDVCATNPIYQSLDLQKACVDWLKNNIAITKTSKDVYLTQGKTVIAQTVSDCLKKSYDFSCIEKIDALKQQTLSDASSVSTPDFKQSLVDYAESSKAIIHIGGYATGWKAAGTRLVPADYGQIVSMEQDALKKISDPDARNYLIQATNNTIKDLGGTQQQIDNGTYLKAYNSSNRTSDGGFTG